MTLETTYLGSAGTHLWRMILYNEPPPAPLSAGFQARRPFPQLGDIQAISAPSNSCYHALDVRLQQRFHAGFTLLSSFTWGKSIDDGDNIRSTTSEDQAPINAYNLKAERGRSNFDQKRHFTNSWVYELPLGSGHRFLGNARGVLNNVIGGWQTGGILTLSDGMPFSVFCSSLTTIQNGGGTSGFESCFGNATGINPNLPRSQQNVHHFFNTAAFVNQPIPEYGNEGRNTVTGPGIIDWDFSMMKIFRFNERSNLEFRAEFFNFPNHPIFGLPGNTIGSGSYGTLTSTLIDSREIQFALKVHF
jgi:hypothetical protein